MAETVSVAELVNSPASRKKAAIIDDAFDDVKGGEIAYSDFTEFWQIADESGDLTAILSKLNISVPNLSRWDDSSEEYLEFLNDLWVHRTNPELADKIDHEKLFSNKIAKLKDIQELCSCIEKQNIEIVPYNSRPTDLEKFEAGEFIYIFIDYNLGVIPGPEAIANARGVVKKIYDVCPKENKPVTILMSTENVDKAKKEKFQQDADMLEGVFRFTIKSDLTDDYKVSLLVRAYKEEFQSNHALQEYINALVDAGKFAQEQFEKEVKTLRIEDYEFIQESVLQKQQQPLGDYLAWLYGSHWATLLLRNERLMQKQKNIDEVFSQKKALHHEIPSPKLAEMFMNALFEQELSDIEYHPWEGIDKSVAQLPYLHLGDVLIKTGERKTFMILNPQCDLERPSEGKKSRSIFILPGHLKSFEGNDDSKEAKTDFFVFEDKRFRIFWNIHETFTISYLEFEKWQKNSGLVRNFRLRLPFALEIQQRFTSHMSRVGIPVSPPLSNSINLEVKYRKHDDTLVTFLAANENYAFLPVTRSDKQEIRLTIKFALDFKEKLVGELSILSAEKESYGEHPPKKLVGSLDKLSNFLNEFDNWFFDSRSFTDPSTDVKNLPKELVLVTRNSRPEGSFKTQTSFLINLITPITPLIIEDDAVEAHKGEWLEKKNEEKP